MRKVVTFDAYGTLVDFDLGLVTRSILADRLGMDGLDVEEFLDDFRVMRFQAVLEDYRTYRELLPGALRHAMQLHGLPYSDDDGDSLVAAVPEFGPFPEVPGALRRLKERYDIAIISNTDDDLIKGNLDKIGVPFDYVITAEQARAYKPEMKTFEYARTIHGRAFEDVIHVAQGWEYDIIPTRGLPMRRVWINRYGRRGSTAYQPYDELTDLSGLPELLGL